MYINDEVLFIIEYKSYLTISVCMHSFVKRAYTHSWTRGCMGSWQTRAYKPILWNNL